MSSVRIESSAFGDDRFEMLARKAGLADADHARGKMARLWRTCTIEQRHILSLEEVELVLGDRGPSALIASRLGEEARGGIRICGTKGRIEPKSGIWTYVVRSNQGGIKIGRSRSPETRIASLQTGSSGLLTTIRVVAGDVEATLHRALARFRTHGEWFQDECLYDLHAILDEMEGQ